MSNGDDAKKAILARRARFVAAAIAGISMGCGKERSPEPCLSVTAPADDAATKDAATTTPRPCLTVAPVSPPPPEPDAAAPRKDAGR